MRRRQSTTHPLSSRKRRSSWFCRSESFVSIAFDGTTLLNPNALNKPPPPDCPCSNLSPCIVEIHPPARHADVDTARPLARIVPFPLPSPSLA